MRLSASIGMISLVALAVSTADAATITGTVKGPDGQAFRGAFVQARSAKTKAAPQLIRPNRSEPFQPTTQDFDKGLVARPRPLVVRRRDSKTRRRFQLRPQRAKMREPLRCHP